MRREVAAQDLFRVAFHAVMSDTGWLASKMGDEWHLISHQLCAVLQYGRDSLPDSHFPLLGQRDSVLLSSGQHPLKRQAAMD